MEKKELLQALSQVMNESLVPICGRLDQIDGRLGEMDGRLEGMNGRLGEMDSRLGEMDRRLEKVDQRLEQVDQRLERVDQRLERVDQRLEQVDQRLDLVDQKLEAIDQDLEQLNERLGKIEFTVENEIRPNIQKLAEGHDMLYEKVIALEANYADLADLNQNVALLIPATQRNSTEIEKLKSLCGGI